jgi:hypothetical protein
MDTNRERKNLSKITTRKSQKDEWTAVKALNLQCRTMYKRKSQTTHNIQAKTQATRKSGFFTGASMD